jgi:hypothetical protein
MLDMHLRFRYPRRSQVAPKISQYIKNNAGPQDFKREACAVCRLGVGLPTANPLSLRFCRTHCLLGDFHA